MFVLLACLVVVAGLMNFNEGNQKLQKSFISHPPNQAQSSFTQSKIPINSGPDDICSKNDLISIYANVSSIDTRLQNFNLHFLFYPCGVYAIKDSNQNRFNLAADTQITIGENVFRFPGSLPMSSQDYSSKFILGSPNSYPFDNYQSSSIPISASLNDQDVPIPIQVTIVGALQTFSIQLPDLIDISTEGNGLAVEATLVVSRSFTTKLFSLFVIMTMWVLSSLTFFLALTPWIRKYRVEAPALMTGNTLLFALPSLRNAQAGIPDIGCTADVVSFFWCELLVAASSCLLLLNYIYYSHRPPPSVGSGATAAATAAAASVVMSSVSENLRRSISLKRLSGAVNSPQSAASTLATPLRFRNVSQTHNSRNFSPLGDNYGRDSASSTYPLVEINKD